MISYITTWLLQIGKKRSLEYIILTLGASLLPVVTFFEPKKSEADLFSFFFSSCLLGVLLLTVLGEDLTPGNNT